MVSLWAGGAFEIRVLFLQCTRCGTILLIGLVNYVTKKCTNKVVNLERELYNLRSELAVLTGKTDESILDYDGGGGGDAADDIRKAIEKKQVSLATERRSVFRGWLKNIFLGQAVISFALSWVMATNPAMLFGGYDWFHSYNM